MFSILVMAIGLSGCGDSANIADRQPSIEGITLADLAVPAAETRTPVLLFMVTTYLVDASYLEAVRSCYEGLPQDLIRFSDKHAFESHGFWASQGTGMDMGPVGDCLVLMGAELYGHSTLILDTGLESPFSATAIEHETLAILSSDGVAQSVVLRNGSLGWMLTAGVQPGTARRATVRVEPVFTPHGLMNWPVAEHLAQRMATRIDTGRFDVSMREADFVILAVHRDSLDELTPLEQHLFVHPGREKKVKVFAIVCVKLEG